MVSHALRLIYIGFSNPARLMVTSGSAGSVNALTVATVKRVAAAMAKILKNFFMIIEIKWLTTWFSPVSNASITTVLSPTIGFAGRCTK